MKKSLLFAAAAATLTFVTPALAAPMHDHAAAVVTGGAAFHPITDADILALGGAPGTATMVSGAALDPIVDADLLALGLSSGNAEYTERVALDPLLDADLLALISATGASGSAACCAMATKDMPCGHM